MKKTLKKTLTVKRPWGSFIQFIQNEPATVKLIVVTAGQALSLQYHHDREEFWRVLSGEGAVVIGGRRYRATVGREFFVPAGTLHRIIANTDMQLLEIATGHFEETDIVRVADIYGRAKKKRVSPK